MLQLGRSDAIASVYLHDQEWDQAIAIAEKNTYGECQELCVNGLNFNKILGPQSG